MCRQVSSHTCPYIPLHQSQPHKLFTELAGLCSHAYQRHAPKCVSACMNCDGACGQKHVFDELLSGPKESITNDFVKDVRLAIAR